MLLADESSALARAVPQWVAGFAQGASNTIVLFPERTPSYPSANLEDVLRHEVAHILIHRAAPAAELPRWFHEGVIVFSTEMLWLAISLLALLAIYRRRKRNAEIEERWAKEDGDGD